MRRRGSTLTLAVASVGLFALAAAPAEAVWVLPSDAPLKDSTGATNGCMAHVNLTVGRADPAPGTQHQQPISIIVEPTLTCDAAADVHWHKFGASLYEVMDDGTLRTVYGPSDLARAESAEPLNGTTWAASHSACRDIGGKGNHTWLVRATVKAKHSAQDPNPFIAKVGASEFLHCS
jgi:hypothetical protein